MKNTINKSEIFKAAWKYVKENNWTLSTALKVAWKEAKEGKNNGIDALSSLVGSTFYKAYLMNGFKITSSCDHEFPQIASCVETLNFFKSPSLN